MDGEKRMDIRLRDVEEIRKGQKTMVDIRLSTQTNMYFHLYIEREI